MTNEVTFDGVQILGESDSKLNVICNIYGRKVSIPKTEITASSEISRVGEYGTLVLTDFICGILGLISLE